VNKYRAQKTEVDGITFDSKREAARYLSLKTMQAAGLISGLRLQPAYTLVEGFTWQGERVRPIVYKADFEYTQAGRLVADDTKGMRTPVYLLKLKLFKFRYPDILHVES
jgi:hypothetical protein